MLGFSKQFQGLSRSKLLFDCFENEKYLKVIFYLQIAAVKLGASASGRALA